MDRRQFLQTTTMAGVAFVAEPMRLLGRSTPMPGAVVATTAGRVRGLLIDGVQAFKAIPYGASTAGAADSCRRPPVTPWTGVREAFAFGPRSPQISGAVRARVAAADRHRADERRLPRI